MVELTPVEACDRLKSEADAIYLDVRTVPEFEQGHPEGAWNIPVFLAGPAGMTPNPDFERVAALVLPREATILVGCKAGGRSAHACGVLAAMGIVRVINVAGGFGGAVDPRTGQTLVPGWQECGLPCSSTPAPGRTWSELSETP